MYDKEVMICIVIGFIVLLGMFLYGEWKSPNKKHRKAPQASDKEAVTVKPVEIVPQPEGPKVAALRSAARQSLQINLLALEAEKQMAEIARLHRTDTTTRRNPQSDPYYRRAEWMQDNGVWRQARF